MEINAPSVPQLPLTATHLLRGRFYSRPSLLFCWSRSSGLTLKEPLPTLLYGSTESTALRALQHSLAPHWIIHSASIQRKHTFHFLQHPAFEGLPFSVSIRQEVAQLTRKKKKNLNSIEWPSKLKKNISCFVFAWDPNSSISSLIRALSLKHFSPIYFCELIQAAFRLQRLPSSNQITN